MPFDAGGLGQDVLSGAVSAGLDAVGAGASARSQYHYQKRLYKHRYQWQMKDMAKAGLNPMLAFSQGAPSPGNAEGADFSRVGDKAVSAFQASRTNRLQADNISANTDLARATAARTYAEGRNTELEVWLKEADPSYQAAIAARKPGEAVGTSAVAQSKLDLFLSKQGADIRSTLADADLKDAQRALTEGTMSLQQIQIQYAPEMAKIAQAYQESMAEAAKAGVPAAKADGEFWAKAGPWAKLAVFIKSMIK